MIAASGLSFSFGGTPVLQSLDLRVEPGGSVVLVGPSGCGKSTLLRVLCGLLEPTLGRVERPEPSPGRVAVAMVFQDPRLLPWMTVSENLSFALEAAGLPRFEWKERAAPLLAQVGLEGTLDLRPRQLSGGMSQRVALVRALALRPHCLLLDEPFAAVDPLLRERLQEDLGALLVQTDTTAVMVTHDVGEALVMGQRVAVLGGRPAGVVRWIDVPGHRPRTTSFRTSAQFVSLERSVREALGGARAAPS